MTYTNEEVHKIISKNLKRSAIYSGSIKGVGPRYCPSIEIKLKNLQISRGIKFFRARGIK